MFSIKLSKLRLESSWDEIFRRSLNQGFVGGMKLNQVVQFKYPEGDFYKLLQVYDLKGIEYKKVFPVTEAQDLKTTLILSVEMRAEVQAADLGAESQQLTTGHLDGSILKSEEEAAPGVALVAFKMIGFVE